ncbi:MAG: hypothetical protein MHPSP_001034 [Paramarteilia canceri]
MQSDFGVDLLALQHSFELIEKLGGLLSLISCPNPNEKTKSAFASSELQINSELLSLYNFSTRDEALCKFNEDVWLKNDIESGANYPNYQAQKCAALIYSTLGINIAKALKNFKAITTLTYPLNSQSENTLLFKCTMPKVYASIPKFLNPAQKNVYSIMGVKTEAETLQDLHTQETKVIKILSGIIMANELVHLLNLQNFENII